MCGAGGNEELGAGPSELPGLGAMPPGGPPGNEDDTGGLMPPCGPYCPGMCCGAPWPLDEGGLAGPGPKGCCWCIGPPGPMGIFPGIIMPWPGGPCDIPFVALKLK